MNHFKCNGYEYRTTIEHESDNKKIFHWAFNLETRMERAVDHSPYSYMNPDQFAKSLTGVPEWTSHKS